MEDLFVYINKEYFNNKKVTILCIDSNLEWDAEIKGKEPGYDTFIEFITELIFEIVPKGNIYMFEYHLKKINNKNHLLNILKKKKSYCKWLFIFKGFKRNVKIVNFSPYYLTSRNIYEYDAETISNVQVLFYLEIGLKYFEIQSANLEEEQIIPVINKTAVKYNYNLYYLREKIK